MYVGMVTASSQGYGRDAGVGATRNAMTLRKSLAWVAMTAFLALAAAGCKGEPQGAADLARAEERLNLVSNPTLYLQARVRDNRGTPPDDDGAPEERSVSVSVRNTSHFSVGDIDGEVVWLDESEHRLGATPFVLHDSLAPDHVSHFLVDLVDDAADAPDKGRSFGARAATLQVVFNHVRVLQ
jgi:hypothetical protein